ncbi:ankyrin repeat [Fusarium longipes]|uniref:Ankyrin repeat n=1 Tax=Fusarium longipes TaxID=694270 RepID=A0A395T4H0_9HYPO|nr:ankyrin repeat [Fusarium longipes]
MSESESPKPHDADDIIEPEILLHIRQLELKLIFDTPPDLATSKDLILDRHPWGFKWWPGNPEPEERYNTTGLTPLACAIKQGKVEEAQRLVKEGARADVYGPEFGSLAHMAVALSYEEIHKIFPLLKLVIEAGADASAPGPAPERESLLCMVIRTLNLHSDYRHAICRYLIEDSGVDVNKRSQSTYPIILAAELADRKLVHYLIQHGAKVDISDHHGLRAVHYAVPSASNRCIGLLIKAGADLLSPDNYGRTPLHFAASICCWDFIRIFLDFLPEGYDINVRDNDGWTPLMWACKNTRSEPLKIKILVEDYGADIWPVSYNGDWSALKLANFTGELKGLRFLEPPKGQREITSETGIRLIWDPEFHKTPPGGHHNFNSCSNCRVLTPRPLYNCVDCSERFFLCFKCFGNCKDMHDPDHRLEEHVEPEMSDYSGSDSESDDPIDI